MTSTLQYICDSSLDVAFIALRLLASAVVMQHIFWLNSWSADQASKMLLAEMNFEGGCLSRATLGKGVEKFICGKSTFLRQSRKGKDFQQKPGTSFSSQKLL